MDCQVQSLPAERVISVCVENTRDWLVDGFTDHDAKGGARGACFYGGSAWSFSGTIHGITPATRYAAAQVALTVCLSVATSNEGGGRMVQLRSGRGAIFVRERAGSAKSEKADAGARIGPTRRARAPSR